MKKTVKYFMIAVAAAFMAACAPQEFSKPDLRPVPAPALDDVLVMALTVDATDGWKVNYKADTDHLGVLVWDFGGNIGGKTGNIVDVQYLDAGTYSATYKVMNPSGVTTEGSETVSVTTTESIPVSLSSTTDTKDGWKVALVANVPEGNTATWDFGEDDGGKMTGNKINATFLYAGEHTATVTLANTNGSKTYSFTTTEDMPFDPKPIIAALSEGTWIVDAGTAGYIGNGPGTATKPEWWIGGANAAENAAMFDDVLTFNADGVYEFDPGEGGQVLVNEVAAPAYAGVSEQPGGSTAYAYVQPTGEQKWSVGPPSGSEYPVLSFTNGGFPSYVFNNWTTTKYQILSTEDGILSLRIPDGGNAFFLRFKLQAEDEE